MKNSADRGGFYPPRPKAEEKNTLRDLQNKGLFKSANTLHIVDVVRRVVFLLYLSCFWTIVRLETSIKCPTTTHFESNSNLSPDFLG